MREKYVLMGVTADGDKIAVEATLEAKNGKPFNTVEHVPAGDAYHELAISGASWRKGRSLTNPNGGDAYGQMSEQLRKIVKPAGTLTRSDLRRLADIWDRYHLNGMRAGCAHMELPEDTSYDARSEIRCPLTGYKYGSAWLVEPLPNGVWKEIVGILAKGGAFPE